MFGFFFFFSVHGWGVSEMSIIDPPLCLWNLCWKRDTEINRHSWNCIVLHRTVVVLVSPCLALQKNLTIILDAVCWKSWHIHACSSVSLLVHNEYALPTGLCSLLAPTLTGGNCSALRKSAVMATVTNVHDSTSNFLYPHMVAIRGFSTSNFIWYSFSDCRRSQVACCYAAQHVYVDTKGYPPQCKAWQVTWFLH